MMHMNLTPWNPAREMVGIRDRINRLFDDFFYPQTAPEERFPFRNWRPSADIYENENDIIVKAELPGIDKKNIHVELKGNLLTLRGERAEDKEVNEENCLRKERVYGKFERTFTLPEEADPNAVKANYKDGVLTVTVPKTGTQKAKQITIH